MENCRTGDYDRTFQPAVGERHFVIYWGINSINMSPTSSNVQQEKQLKKKRK